MEGIVIENPISYPEKNVLIVRCMRIKKDAQYFPVEGSIRLVIPPDLNFNYGDFIRFQSALKNIHSFKNPGGFDYEKFLNRQGIYASGFVPNNSGIILLRGNSASSWKLMLESFRNYLRKIIYENSSSPQREIITAMIIGDQNAIPAEIRDNFNKTGTSHILSISGLHIGMVAATAFFFIIILLQFSEYLMLRFNIIKIAAAASFILVLIYALIAGMEVTVVRSALMALIFLVALISGKQRDLYNTLALAGLIILIISPEALFDISFQLSFLSVLALIYIVPRFSSITSTSFQTLPRWGQSTIRYLKMSIIVCLAATIGTLPLIIYYFNRVSAITVIANLIVVPLLGEVALAISMLAIIFAFSPLLAGLFIKAASFITQLSIIIINKLADLSWSSFTITKPGIFEIILFYLFFILLIKFIDAKREIVAKNTSQSRQQSFLLYGLIVALTLLISTTVYFSVKDKFSSNLKITAIDVGQGNSTLVRFPGGKTMLIDGGGFPDSTFDMGKMVIAPFLYHERISQIDTVVLTHPHPDHYEGLRYILENFHVKEFWFTGYDTNDEDYINLQKIISQNNIKKIFLSRQSATININGTDISIFWPSQPYIAAGSHSSSDNATNDSSLVFKIKYGDINFLITGDISAEIEEQLLQSKQNIKSNVLFVPHHGSKHSSSEAFIRKVASQYAVVSAGKNNVFHHPHPSVIRRYEDAGVHIFRTDQDGAVTFTTDGISLTEDTFIKSK